METDDPSVQRIARAHRNDVEALLPFAIVGALYVASGASGLSGYAFFALFTAARSVHTAAYFRATAEMRRNAFTVAWLLILVMGAHALIVLLASLSAD